MNRTEQKQSAKRIYFVLDSIFVGIPRLDAIAQLLQTHRAIAARAMEDLDDRKLMLLSRGVRDHLVALGGDFETLDANKDVYKWLRYGDKDAVDFDDECNAFSLHTLARLGEKPHKIASAVVQATLHIACAELTKEMSSNDSTNATIYTIDSFQSIWLQTASGDTVEIAVQKPSGNTVRVAINASSDICLVRNELADGTEH